MKVLPHNPPHGIVKRCERPLNGRWRIGVGDSRHGACFARVVEVHPADLLLCSFLDKMSVDMKLSSVKLQPLLRRRVVHVRLLGGFEVHNLDGIVNAPDKVNLALDDVVWLDEAHVNLGLFNERPVAVLMFNVPHDVLQRGVKLCRAEIRVGGL